MKTSVGPIWGAVKRRQAYEHNYGQNRNVMSLEYIAQQLVNGLILGSMYAMVAIGFSMIYGIIRLINFAHGDVVMIGAFITLALLQVVGAPFPLVALVVLAAGAVVGILIEKGAFRPMRGAPQVTGFIASLAVSIMLQNLGVLFLTAQPRNFTFPDYLQRVIQVAGVSFRVVDAVIMLAALILMCALMLLVNKTRLGMAMRATAENIDVARLMGININRTITATFAIGSALAGIAGLMWGGKFGQIDPLLGFIPGLKAFVAAVIGGVGSIPGAILGGFVLGVAEVLFVGLLPPIYSAFRDAFVFSTLILILLILPNGILGQRIEERT
jgi:branched-chain amino acid transport system permease protein